MRSRGCADAALRARARARARRLKKAISALRFKTLVARPRELHSCRARGYRKLLYHAWRCAKLSMFADAALNAGAWTL